MVLVGSVLKRARQRTRIIRSAIRAVRCGRCDLGDPQLQKRRRKTPGSSPDSNSTVRSRTRAWWMAAATPTNMSTTCALTCTTATAWACQQNTAATAPRPTSLSGKFALSSCLTMLPLK